MQSSDLKLPNTKVKRVVAVLLDRTLLERAHGRCAGFGLLDIRYGASEQDCSYRRSGVHGGFLLLASFLRVSIMYN